MTIDLHNHASMMPFGSSPDGPAAGVRLYTPLRRPQNSGLLNVASGSVTEVMAMLHELTLDSQSDFTKQKQGGVRISTVVLGSFESGFANLIPDRGLLKIPARLAFSKSAARVVESLVGVHYKRVQFIRDQLHNEQDQPSYYTEFMKELSYVLSHKNETFHAPGESSNTTIQIPENVAELSHFYTSGENNLIAIFALEGMQSMGIGLKSNGLEPNYIQRIESIKRSKCIFLYAGLNHHFKNTLGGHAKSFGGTLATLLKQKPDPHAGLTADGRKVLDALLDRTGTGKRILPDIKHMNLKTRQDYYAYLEQRGDKVPILCSHTGVTNSSWAAAMADPVGEDTDQRNSNGYFHIWSINLFKEDVLKLVDSKGLLGIQLDEKRIGGGRLLWILQNRKMGFDYDWNDGLRDLFLANVLSVVETVYEALKNMAANVLTQKLEDAWACIGIGSDFDGVINPIDSLPTAKEFPAFIQRASDRLSNPGLFYSQEIHGWELPNSRIQILLNGKSGSERIRQVFAENAYRFFDRVLTENGYA